MNLTSRKNISLNKQTKINSLQKQNILSFKFKKINLKSTKKEWQNGLSRLFDEKRKR
jgi:hypothetical protein